LAGRFDETRGVAGVVVLVQVGDEDVGTFTRERDGDRTPDAAVSAGDDRDLPVELAGAAVAVLPPPPRIPLAAVRYALPEINYWIRNGYGMPLRATDE
jgi:hypothetical protein